MTLSRDRKFFRAGPGNCTVPCNLFGRAANDVSRQARERRRHPQEQVKKFNFGQRNMANESPTWSRNPSAVTVAPLANCPRGEYREYADDASGRGADIHPNPRAICYELFGPRTLGARSGQVRGSIFKLRSSLERILDDWGVSGAL